MTGTKFSQRSRNNRNNGFAKYYQCNRFWSSSSTANNKKNKINHNYKLTTNCQKITFKNNSDYIKNSGWYCPAEIILHYDNRDLSKNSYIVRFQTAHIGHTFNQQQPHISTNVNVGLKDRSKNVPLSPSSSSSSLPSMDYLKLLFQNKIQKTYLEKIITEIRDFNESELNQILQYVASIRAKRYCSAMFSERLLNTNNDSISTISHLSAVSSTFSDNNDNNYNNDNNKNNKKLKPSNSSSIITNEQRQQQQPKPNVQLIKNQSTKSTKSSSSFNICFKANLKKRFSIIMKNKK